MEGSTAAACAFAAVFLLVMAFFYLVNRMARHMMELPLIAVIERAGGAALGGVKSLLIACAVLVILALIRVEAVSSAVSQDSFFGTLAISSAPEAYRLAVRVYPEVEKLRAGEVIEKLPAAGGEKEAAAEGEERAGSPAPASDYITP